MATLRCKIWRLTTLVGFYFLGSLWALKEKTWYFNDTHLLLASAHQDRSSRSSRFSSSLSECVQCTPTQNRFWNTPLLQYLWSQQFLTLSAKSVLLLKTDSEIPLYSQILKYPNTYEASNTWPSVVMCTLCTPNQNRFWNTPLLQYLWDQQYLTLYAMCTLFTSAQQILEYPSTPILMMPAIPDSQYNANMNIMRQMMKQTDRRTRSN